MSKQACCSPVARAPLTEAESVEFARMFEAIADRVLPETLRALSTAVSA